MRSAFCNVISVQQQQQQHDAKPANQSYLILFHVVFYRFGYWLAPHWTLCWTWKTFDPVTTQHTTCDAMFSEKRISRVSRDGVIERSGQMQSVIFENHNFWQTKRFAAVVTFVLAVSVIWPIQLTLFARHPHPSRYLCHTFALVQNGIVCCWVYQFDWFYFQDGILINHPRNFHSNSSEIIS